jgi:hemoglobin
VLDEPAQALNIVRAAGFGLGPGPELENCLEIGGLTGSEDPGHGPRLRERSHWSISLCSGHVKLVGTSFSAEWHGSQPDYILLMGDDPTLYEWAGGRGAFDRLINAFYDRVEQDELLSPLFPGGVHEEHRRNVATWWSEVFGGPSDYTDRIGGYERMVGRHLQLRITNDQRFRFVSLMSLAADDANLPSDPEFRSALVAYLEWGTRLALGNSQTGAEVVEHAPVPRWGWGEAPPYQP